MLLYVFVLLFIFILVEKGVEVKFVLGFVDVVKSVWLIEVLDVIEINVLGKGDCKIMFVFDC